MPSGLNATLLTAPVCPLRVRVSWPVAASQTFTVWSSLPEARRLPSGLNATLVTVAGVPLEGEGLLAGRRVPDLHRLVAAGGGEALAVGAERHAVDRAGVPLERERLLAGRRVPDLHRLVAAGGGECVAVGAERHASDPVGVPLEGEELSWPVAASQTFTVCRRWRRRAVCRRG